MAALAKLLVGYSTALKKGDRILLDMMDVPDEFTIELIRAARSAGALPVVETRHTRVGRELLRETDGRQAALARDLELFRMKKMQAYIAIRGSENASENAKKCEEVALAVWRGLKCRDGGRVDVRMDANGVVNFIEVNPLAGLNYITSDLPIMCGLKGIAFNDLIKDIMTSAEKRVTSKE